MIISILINLTKLRKEEQIIMPIVFMLSLPTSVCCQVYDLNDLFSSKADSHRAEGFCKAIGTNLSRFIINSYGMKCVRMYQSRFIIIK